MDLSKIPEPSEGELAAMASFLEPREDYYGPISCVLAHLLRHGSVLAAFAKRHNMHKSSVEFFEKFGGNDDR